MSSAFRELLLNANYNYLVYLDVFKRPRSHKPTVGLSSVTLSCACGIARLFASRIALKHNGKLGPRDDYEHTRNNDKIPCLERSREFDQVEPSTSQRS
jgi:hypothetical protein